MTDVYQSASARTDTSTDPVASTDAVEPGETAGAIETRSWRTAWTAFREWRRSRPFWAGIFAIASGLLVLFPPFASLKFGDVVVTLNTFSGITALVIGVVVIACGVSFWTRPQFRFIAGVVTLLLALVAIVTANLGTFLIGTLLGIVGAALGIAWSPKQKKARRPRGSEKAGAAPRRSAGQGVSSEPVETSRSAAHEHDSVGGHNLYVEQTASAGRSADAGGRV